MRKALLISITASAALAAILLWREPPWICLPFENSAIRNFFSFCGNWPLEPRDTYHSLGTTAGEFQNLQMSPPHFHDGLDIRDDHPYPDGPYVLTKNGGTVHQIPSPGCGRDCTIDILVNTNSHEKYDHLDYRSIPQEVKNHFISQTPLPANRRLGQLAPWYEVQLLARGTYEDVYLYSCEYHHLHFQTCDGTGCLEPVLDLYPKETGNRLRIDSIGFTSNDDNPPITRFHPFRGGPGNSFLYTPVRGLVDIVVLAYDRDFHIHDNRLGVLKIAYEVAPWGAGVVLSNTIDFSKLGPDVDWRAPILFRDSTSNYCFEPPGERYNYVVTNVRCDSGTCITKLDDSDNAKFATRFAWDTTRYLNGFYRVNIIVWDFAGNQTSRVALVMVDNVRSHS
jgi:hypothetical protein